jgi:diguanylate cyclase (GGDEF)-like protein/PAS domain S-box-containing protein
VLVEGILRSRHMLAVVDDRGVISHVNDAFRDLGWKPGEIIGRSPFEFVHPDDIDRAVVGLETIGEAPRPIPTTFRMRRGDGVYEALEVGASRVHVDGRDWLVFLFSRAPFQSMAARVLALLASGSTADAALGALASDLGEVIPGLLVGIAFDGAEGRRTVVGHLEPALAGVRDGIQDGGDASPWGRCLATGEAVSVTDLDALAGLDPSLDAVRDRARQLGLEGAGFFPVPDAGSTTPALLAVWYRPPRVQMFMDIYLAELPVDLVRLTLAGRHERAQLERLARQDALTGLANRAAFFGALDRSAQRHARQAADRQAGAEPSAAVAVIYLDLDGFKPVNDTHGHEAGDLVLATLAERFRAVVRGSDVVARIGGDEFAVLCDGVRDEAEARGLAERLVTAASEPVPTGDVAAGDPAAGSLRVGASAGIAVVDDFLGRDPGAVLAAADEALYRAKRAGKGRVELAVVADPAAVLPPG